jgi:hypothetical protein
MSIRLVRSALLASLLALGACPAPKSDGTGPGGGGATGDDTGPTDAELSYAKEDLNGTYFVPEALDRPSMLIAAVPKKTTIAKQRAAYAKAKGDAKIDQALVLMTMLYQTGQASEDDSTRLGMIEEARKLLDDVARAFPAKVSVVVYHNLACLSYDVGDTPGAIAALEAAIAKAPGDPAAAERRAYLAYYQLRAGNNAAAADAVAGMTPSKSEPELAYAIAWAAWRTGDLPTARAAMLAAAQGWRLKGYLPAMKRDVLIFAARADASVAEAVELARAYAEHMRDQPDIKSPDDAVLQMLAFMHQAFEFTGRFADTIQLIDKMFAVKKNLDKADVPKLRMKQAEAAKRLGNHAELVAYVKQGLDALKACGKACDAAYTKQLAQLTFNYARYANNLYTTAQDERWYEAGKELYALYLGIPGIADAEVVKAEAANLDGAFQHAKKNAGTHDQTVLGFVVSPYTPQVLGCYDRFLQRDPKLGGPLTLHVEVAADGTVSGASSEPPAGDDGAAGVARCAIAAAREWVFPARSRPGVTRIAVAYVMLPPK